MVLLTENLVCNIDLDRRIGGGYGYLGYLQMRYLLLNTSDSKNLRGGDFDDALWIARVREKGSPRQCPKRLVAFRSEEQGTYDQGFRREQVSGKEHGCGNRGQQ
jgi:hypothetical protein